LQRTLASTSLPNPTPHNRTTAYTQPQTNQPLHVYNRTPAKAAALVAAAAHHGAAAAAPTLTALIKGCHIIHIMLSDDDACDAVVGELLSSDHSKGRLLVNHSTNHPECARRCAEAAAAVGAGYVSAPVFGRWVGD